MRIGPAANVARINVAEEITALWTFANALGLSTDVIGERTADAGVTVDGVQLLDGAVLNNALAAAASVFLRCAVTGDVVNRFMVQADGGMTWGDGAAARDVNLYRAAANLLFTDDSFQVNGYLRAGTEFRVSERTATLPAPADDVDTGDRVVQRLSPQGGGQSLSGFAGGVVGRMIIVINQGSGADFINLLHGSALSAAGNRLLLANGATIVLHVNDSCMLWYDTANSRWRNIGRSI